MVQFNTKDNEILVKIVFYGPGLCGKTTNLQRLHELVDPSKRTDLFSVNTMEDRTLFFDLLPLDLGYVYGNSIKLQIYTVPGQVHYDSTRRIVLSGADGVIFVADSDKSKLHENVQSINNLYHNLQANRLNIKEVPLVMQFNKRDLPNILPIETLNQKLNFRQVPYFEAVATEGEGVLETFLAAVKQTVRYIFEKYQLSKKGNSVDSVIEKLEEAILENASKAKEAASGKGPDTGGHRRVTGPKTDPGEKTVLKYTHTIEEDDRSSQEQLLKKALSSNMETARLYTELKNSQKALVKKNDELSQLYKQLERSNTDNMKIRRFLESLVNFAGEAIISFNDLWIIQNWNQVAQEMFGYRKEEVLNKNINILFPKESVADLNRVLAFVVGGKVVKGFETRLQLRDGGLLPVNMTLSPIKNQNGTIIAFTGIIRDLSFMARTNAKLHHMQRFETTGAILPDLIQTLAPKIEAGLNDEAAKSALAALVHASKVLEGIIFQEDDTAEPVNFNELIGEVHKLLKDRLDAAGIAWTTQLNPSLPAPLMEKQRVMQALINILLNSVASLKEKRDGKITIGTHFTEKELLVQIIDNGSSASSNNFEGGADPDLDRKGNPREIRINATREILEANSASLRVDSAPEKGTKVTIRVQL